MISRIGKCHACKQVSRRDYAATQQTKVGHGMFSRMATIYGREELAFDGKTKVFLRASLDCQCPRCGARAWSAKTLEGVHNDGVRCDARCQGAKGHQCECACGGANHGRGFICE